MGDGRLIRVSKYRSDQKAIAYVVAVPDKATAVELIRRKVVDPSDEIEDLGRVTEALLTAMGLAPGEFTRVDGLRHVAQQQQQPQFAERDDKK
jgi:hypothetical protein